MITPMAAKPPEEQAQGIAEAKQPRKPRAAKALDPAQETISLAQHNELQAKFDALLEEHSTLIDGAKELANEVETLAPFKDGTEVHVMRQLRIEMDQVKRSRNNFMNESAERQGHINFLLKKINRLERAAIRSGVSQEGAR